MKLSNIDLKKNWYEYLIVVSAFIFAIYHFVISLTGIVALWQHRAIHVMMALTVVFILKPYASGKVRNPIAKYGIKTINVVLVLLALALLYFVATNHTQIYFRMANSITIDRVALALCLLLIFLATVKSIGWPMAIIMLVFLAYLFFGHLIPGIVGHPRLSISRITDTLFISTNGIFGQAVGVAATDIIMFVVFASFLSASGAGNFVTDLALSLAGRAKGGPAKTAVIGSALMGMMIGSPVANVAGTGSITIPLMKKLGYDKEFAGAVEAAASSGGMIMPPIMGASVFLMAEYTNTPYLTICGYAALPAVLYYFSVFMMIHLESLKKDIPTLKAEDCPKVLPTLKKGWHYLLAIVFLVYLLARGYSPMRCASFATIALVVLSWFNKESRMGPKAICMGFVAAGKSAASVSIACAAAGVVAGVISTTGAGVKMSTAIMTLSGGHVILALIFSMLASIFLGMGIVAASAYIIVAALAAPALVQMGVPIIAAHLFLYYFGMMANVTPPVALAAYTAAGISGGDSMKTALKATKLASCGIIIPYMFVFDQRLMLQGEVGEVIITAITAIIGCLFLSFGLQQYLWKPMSWPLTILSIGAALCMIYPNMVSTLIGIAIGAITLVIQWMEKKKATPHTT